MESAALLNEALKRGKGMLMPCEHETWRACYLAYYDKLRK